MPTTLPDTFGRYQILKKLGEGGMGAVYLAEDSRLGRRVALKVPHFNDNQNSTILDRFYREARMAARIEHPNLCSIYDVADEGGIHYITMAYIDGQPLSKMVGEGKPWQPGHALDLVRQMALALQVLHEAGIVHRDLKPGNVMIRAKDQWPIIMDFGLARSFQSQSQQLTGNQSPLGTPAYMSPEQVMGDANAIGPRSDIWALGAILYEMLTGRLPFQGGLVQVFAAILHTSPPPPSQLQPGIPPELDMFVMQCLTKNAADRPESMAAVAAILLQMIQQIKTHPDGTLIPPRSGSSGSMPLSTMQPGGPHGSHGSHPALRQTPRVGDSAGHTPAAWSQNPVPMPSSYGGQTGTPPPLPPQASGSWQQLPNPSLPPGSAGHTPMVPHGSWVQAPMHGQPPTAPPGYPSGSGTHPGMHTTTAPQPATGSGQTALLIVAVCIFLLCAGVSAWFIYVIATGGFGRSGESSPVNSGISTTSSKGSDPSSQTKPTEPKRDTGRDSGRDTTPPPVARLTFTTEKKDITLEVGKSDTLPVKLQRENMDAEVTVVVVTPPKGITVTPLKLNGNSGDLAIRVENAARPGDYTLELHASAEQNGKQLSDTAKVSLKVTPRPTVAMKEITNDIGMKFVPIPAGTFTMGSPETEEQFAPDQRPLREVTISKAFYLGVYEVTQGDYERVMTKAANKSAFRPQGVLAASLPDKDKNDTSQYPMDTVSWTDAGEFCKKLSALPNEKAAKRTYRLPTEAEWEYACRASEKGPFNTGAKISTDDANFNGLDNVYPGSDKGVYRKRAMPVGQFKPNKWGLYDMHGNIAEWCSDWHDEDYYKRKENTDPQGPEASPTGERVLRGGWWLSSGANLRSGSRDREKPEGQSVNHRCGFRIVCILGE